MSSSGCHKITLIGFIGHWVWRPRAAAWEWNPSSALTSPLLTIPVCSHAAVTQQHQTKQFELPSSPPWHQCNSSLANAQQW